MLVHLICPGLLGPISHDTAALPPTPALDWLLSRARVKETEPRDPLETLAGAFGLSAAPEADLPSASLCLQALGHRTEPGTCWFHADPVHLRPDRDRLLLFAGPSLRIAPAEAESLVAAFNAHFALDGLHLVTAGPSRWFLRLPKVPRLRTHPLHQVAGRPLDAQLPVGPDAGAWARWQSEAQMLFHAHPVNRERELRGLPALSGVWTWGGGVLPILTQGPQGPNLTVADHPLALGLAGTSGGRSLGLDGWGPSQRAPGDSVLVFWDRLWWPMLEGDAPVWARALGELETLVEGLLQTLRSGRIETLTLDDGQERRFTLSRADLLRFWRRRGTLGDWVSRRAPGSNPSG
jgi:hypothetical protein